MADTTTRPTILVADDNFANRALLEKVFSSEYNVLLAADGVEVLKQLKDHPGAISCVLLDIMMPNLDGFEVLTKMHEDTHLASIPVIVVTSSDEPDDQIHSLDLGAADVVSKPFNTQILLCRVRNTIARSEYIRVSEQNRLYEIRLAQQARRIKASRIDGKTGLLNASGFYEGMTDLIRNNPDMTFCVMRWDIDRFKVYNDVFGTREGDRLLRTMGTAFSQHYDGPLMVCGRLEADNFACCLPREKLDCADFITSITKRLSSYQPTFSFSPRMGVFTIDDIGLDAELMCDRALLALRSSKSSYAQHFAFYDDSMRANLILEQQIVSEMGPALAKGEFCVYLQPQYDYNTGEMSGAEALVRWNHPTKGLISPGSFIPVFERNGFITHLDEYMWEQVCKLLSRWLKEGRDPLPISVNISRYDCYNDQLVDTISNFADAYDIPHDLLHLEITESAYMADPQLLVSIVNEFHERGFVMEMDDFGSGYSSLNTLKDLRMSCLKLDRGFVQESHTSRRGGSILSSIVRMAHWLKMQVLAEGVETKDQAEFLKSIGCTLMQGFLFSKPVPVDEFEKLSRTLPDTVRTERIDTSVDIEGAADFLDASTQSTLLFNSFVGGAAIIEDNGSNVELLRTNDSFYDVLGTTQAEFGDRGMRLLESIMPADQAPFKEMLEETRATGEQAVREIQVKPVHDDEPIWLRVWTRFLAHNMNEGIYYLSIENVTERTLLFEKNDDLTKKLTFVMSTLPGGIAFFEQGDNTTKETFFSASASNMFGYTNAEYHELFSADISLAFHHDDQEAFSAFIQDILQDPEHLHTVRCRHIRKDGGWTWLQLTGHATHTDRGATEISSIFLDISQQVANEQALSQKTDELELQGTFLSHLFDSVPCGIIELKQEDDHYRLVTSNRATWSLIGWPDREWAAGRFADKSSLADIMGDDATLFCENVDRAFNEGTRSAFDQKVLRANGSIGWVHNQVQPSVAVDGTPVVQCVLTDIVSTRTDDAETNNDLTFEGFDEIMEFNRATGMARIRKAPKGSQVTNAVPFMLSGHAEHWISRVTHPDDAELLHDACARLLAGTITELEHFQFRLLSAQGEAQLVTATIAPAGNDLYLVCSTFASNDEVPLTRKSTAPAWDTTNRSLAERLLLLLSKARSTHAAIDMLLDSIGHEYGLSRVWIIYTAPGSNDPSEVNEWMEGRNPDGLQSIRRTALTESFPAILSKANPEGGRIICKDASHGAEPIVSSVAMRGVRSFVVYSNVGEGENTACVGFDDGHKARSWSEDELAAFDFAETILEILVDRLHDERDYQVIDQAYLRTLDRSSALAYIADPETHRIIYCNAAVKSHRGTFEGDICYQAFFNRLEPCKTCPIRELTEHGTTVPLRVSDDATCQTYLMQATPVVLNHRRGVLVCGIDLTVDSSSTDRSSIPTYERKLRDFTHTMFATYDSVIMVDYDASDCTIVAARQNPTSVGKTYSISDLIDNWTVRSSNEKTKEQLASFANRPSPSPAGSEPESFEYRLAYANANDWYRTTAFQLDEARWVICSRNITDEMNARQVVAESKKLTGGLEDREKYRIVVERTGACVIEWNHLTNSFSASSSFSRYALSLDEPTDILAGKVDRSCIYQDDLERYDAFAREVNGGDAHVSSLLRLRMTDGSYHWTRVDRTVIANNEGTPIRTVGILIDVDEETQAKLMLSSANDQLKDIMAHTPLGVAVYDVGDEAKPVFMNDTGLKMFGYTRSDHDRCVAEGRARIFVPDLVATVGPINTEAYDGACHRIVARHKDGTPFWMDAYTSIVEEGDVTRCYAALVDVSKEVTSHERERWLFERYRLLSESSDLITFDLDPHKDRLVISYMRQDELPKEQTIDRCLSEAMTAEPGSWISKTVHPSSIPLYLSMQNRALASPGTLSFTYRANYYGDGWHWYRMKSTSVPDVHGNVARVVSRAEDISAEYEEQEALRHVAETDGLTGLLNKNAAMRLMRHSLQCRTRDRVDAVLMIDIDNFKQINDSAGHLFGDKALKEVGARIKGCFRSGDIVGRFGGDEFIVYLMGIGDAAHAIGKASRVLEEVNAIKVEGIPEIDCCIGIGLLKNRGKMLSLDDLVARADAALYEAKASGKNRYRLYTETMVISAHGALAPVDDSDDLEDDSIAIPFDPTAPTDNAAEMGDNSKEDPSGSGQNEEPHTDKGAGQE